MRHQKTGRKLSRRKSHRTAMLANLAASLIKHGKVRTTEAKAKEVRPFVERLITFAKRGTLHDRRVVYSRLRDGDAVRKLFDEIGPMFTTRYGGYTRILKLGFRQGDNSPMSLIQIIDEEVEKKSTRKKKPVKKTKAKTASEQVVETAPVVEDSGGETEPEVVEADSAVEEAATETAEEVTEVEAAPEPEAQEDTPAAEEPPAAVESPAEEAPPEVAAEEPAPETAEEVTEVEVASEPEIKQEPEAEKPEVEATAPEPEIKEEPEAEAVPAEPSDETADAAEPDEPAADDGSAGDSKKED